MLAILFLNAHEPSHPEASLVAETLNCELRAEGFHDVVSSHDR